MYRKESVPAVIFGTTGEGKGDSEQPGIHKKIHNPSHTHIISVVCTKWLENLDFGSNFKFQKVLQTLKLLERRHRISSTLSNDTHSQDISFGGYFMDISGKVMVGDDGLNGIELGPAVEVTPGWKPADRLAVYTGGSGTDTLSFIYVVQEVSV